jgi:pyridoxamine 5'-phosphate oxidase
MQKVNLAIPFEKFSEWFAKAKNDSRIIEPTAMCIATSNQENQPSARMVLMKHFDHNGFCFFTNFNSNKAQQLKENNKIAACFYWGILSLQIRIEGEVEEVSKKEADDYFASRHPNSQIGAWASLQSSEMNEWSEFENRIEEYRKKFSHLQNANQKIPRPENWSGFRIVPNKIEFWQEGEFRIHKREVYQKFEDGWQIKKLYP